MASWLELALIFILLGLLLGVGAFVTVGKAIRSEERTCALPISPQSLSRAKLQQPHGILAGACAHLHPAWLAARGRRLRHRRQGHQIGRADVCSSDLSSKPKQGQVAATAWHPGWSLRSSSSCLACCSGSAPSSPSARPSDRKSGRVLFRSLLKA